MVRPDEIKEAIARSLMSSNLPDSTNFVKYEPSIEQEPIKLPLVEVSGDTKIRIDEMNSDFVGYQTDSNGNRVGRIYDNLYTFDVNVAVWTSQDSKYDVDKLSRTVRDKLYEHDTKSIGKPLRYDDGSPVGEVWRFRLTDTERTDDLSTSPPLRRWQMVVSINAAEQYIEDADKPPIETVSN